MPSFDAGGRAERAREPTGTSEIRVTAARPRSAPGGVAAALVAAALLAGTQDAQARGGGWGPPAAPPDAPPRLADTGLYADFASRRLAADVHSWTPQYPLWSDGATKRRWIRLPPGTAVDAADPDAWIFPVGTRIWKEFSFGRRVETRYMERRADGTWRYATYAWTPDGADAVLAPASGVHAAAVTGPGTSHDLPSVADCLACHGGGRTPVLGFSALQLSPDRDPLAPHAEPVAPGALDLASAVGAGVVVGLPRALLETPPRVRAPTPLARAAMGYLHGNCSSCHDARGALASLGLDLAQRVRPLPGEGAAATTVGVPSRYQPPGASGPLPRVAPGEPDLSALVARISSRDRAAQMPPIGTQLVDRPAVALVREWIAELAASRDRGRLVAARPGPRPNPK